MTKPGFKHKWKYHSETWNETKIKPRTWVFTLKQTKYRKGKKAPPGTGMPIGSRLVWKINATQYALKTGPNTYKLIMKGIKKQKAYSTKRTGRMIRT